MKINNVNVELAINEAEILDLLENYEMDLDPTVTPGNIRSYVEEQRSALLAKHQHLSNVIKGLYEAKLRELTQGQEKTQTEIASGTLALEQLVHSASHRKEFCSKANDALNTLQKIISKESPFSVLQLSKEELLACFECQPTDRVAELITAMYDEEQAKNSWYGLNRKNIWSKFSNPPTQETEEETELMGLINDRLKQINKELPFDKLNRKKTPQAPQNLAENNLYSLSRFYQNGKRQLQEKETSLAQQKEHFATITEQQNTVLKELEAKKSEQEQALLQAQLQMLLTGVATRLEKLTIDCNTFQTKITTVDKLIETVEKVLGDLKTKNIDEILELISTNHPLFLMITEFVNQDNFSENSIHQINQNIHNVLIAIKEELAGLQNIADEINPMPLELAERQKLLMSQLEELESTHSILNTSLQSLLQSLSNSKNLLDPFIKLAEIKNQYAHLIEQITQPEMADLQRQELISAIEIIRREKIEFLKLIRSEKYEGLLTLKQVKHSLKDQENILNDVLIADRLDQIKDNYLKLVEKSKVVASTDSNEVEVIELVHGIEELDKQSSFLEKASLSKNPAIQRQRKAVSGLREELNASIYGQYENTTRIVTELYDAQLIEEQKKQTKTNDDISATKIVLDTLIADAEARKVFLAKAQDILGELKNILLEKKENKILQTPKQEVLAYCEDAPTGRTSILINELYDLEQSKSDWYGFNRKNFWNRITFSTTFAASQELIDLIDARLLQIKNELEINDITETVERPSMPSNLAEKNLYALSASHQDTQNSLAEKQVLLEQQMDDSKKITHQKGETLTLLESMKTTHEAQILLNRMNNEQDQVEKQVLLFEQQIGLLQQTYLELNDVIDTIDPALKEKITHQEKSLLDLSKQINESLQAHSHLFEEFEIIFSKITNKPSSMIEQKEALLKKFNELKTEKVKSDEFIRPQILQAKKMLNHLESIALRARTPKQGIGEQTDVSLNTPLHLLSNVYFGTETERTNAEFGLGGLFGSYLEERAHTFWFKDFLSTVAAFALGCIGYKTGAQKRQEYLTNDLQPALMIYQNEPTMESYEDLIKVIKEGKIQFPPRAAHNEIDKSKSLLSKLTQLETEVIKINLSELKLEETDEHSIYRNAMN